MRKLLEQTQWWDIARLRELQLRRLDSLVRHARDRVPYYQKLFAEIGFDSVYALCDLARLPLLSKCDIRAYCEELKARGARDLTQYGTSGSTGEPLTFWVSRGRISHDIAAKWRAMRWWGLDIGDREVVVWGPPVKLGARNQLRNLRDVILRTRLLPIKGISNPQLDEYLKVIQRARPKMLFGYPSALARLATRANETGVDTGSLGIEVAFVTSEMLTPEWRQSIEQTFSCKVANEYGAKDAGFLARECPRGGMHITAEDLIVEIVDEHGRVVAPGEFGEVVVTHLMSAGFPFIRYRTGDIAALDPRLCECGRALPLIKDIRGRTNECLVAANGSLVHDSALNYVIRDLGGVQAYKVIQDSLHKVRVLLIPGPRLPADHSVRIRAAYQALLGPEIDVSIETVGSIAPEPSGKHRHIVCHVSREVSLAS
ncbi:MAG: phenylacetate--CoA ligase family protein [Burkholderiales bacterium]